MEYYALKVLFLPFLCPSFAGAVTTTLRLALPDQPVCSGELVTYICTVGGNIITWHIPDGQFSQVYGRNEGDEGGFHWKILERPMGSNTVQSTLTFSAVEGYMIGCRNTSEELVSLQVQVEGPPGAPDQPLTSITSIHQINNTFSTLTLVWTRPAENSDHISRYVITVDPPIPLPANGSVGLADPLFTDREITVILRHQQRYSFRVRADNCNNTQQGAFSTALNVTLQFPPPARSCTATAVYDYFSNHLTSIEILWEKVSNQPEQIAPGITADIQSYQVSLTPTTENFELSINTTIRDLTICQEKCAVVIPSAGMTSLYYSVFVTAENLLGPGQKKSCNSQTIGARNDLVAMEVKQYESGIEVSCRLLSGFVGISHCEITYGTVPNGKPYASVDTSEKVGTRGDIITIKLSHPLEADVTYYYNLTIINLSVTVKVFGTFQTAGYCQARNLGLLEQNQSTQSERAANIKVCYTGTATGSLAYYISDDGNESSILRGTILNSRECQQDGQWRKQNPECTSIQEKTNGSIAVTDESPQMDVPTTCAASLAILGTTSFLSSFLAGIIIGVILMWLYTSRKTTQVSNSLYDNISEPEKTRIAIEHNQSCGRKPELPTPRRTSSTDAH